MLQIKWSPRSPLEKSYLGDVPKEPGVYRILAKQSFGRLVGTSDIIYVGCSSKGTQGLWLELANLLNPHRNHIYTLLPLLQTKTALDFEFWLTTPSEAESLEYHLLDEYEQRHLELPPRNRSKPGHDTCSICKDRDK